MKDDRRAELFVFLRDHIQRFTQVLLRYHAVHLQEHDVAEAVGIGIDDLLKQHFILPRRDRQHLLDMLPSCREIPADRLVFLARPELLIRDLRRIRDFAEYIVLQHLRAADFDALLAQRHRVLHRVQRGAAEIGEPVVGTDEIICIEDIRRCQQQTRDHLAVQHADCLPLSLGLRQLLAHYLAVEVARERVHAHPNVRDHILRQIRGDFRLDRLFIKLARRLVIAGQVLGAADGFDHHDDLPDVGALEPCHRVGDLRLDLACFDAEAAQLDHVVGASEDIIIALGRADGSVAGVEPAHAIPFNPLFRAEGRQLEIPLRHVVVGNH